MICIAYNHLRKLPFLNVKFAKNIQKIEINTNNVIYYA